MKGLLKKDIVAGLRALGLRNGDSVMVHTSLASFGKVVGGADTVIDAMLKAVGPDGTVMVPTFGESDKIFDVTKSPTYLGAVPQAFWKRKEALRSRHPLASVAAIGAKAKWLVEGHENAKIAHGADTPYMRLAEIGGKILLLGVDQDRNTFLHAAEELAKSPYLRTVKGNFIDASGKERTKSWPLFPGPHRDFIGMQGWLESAGLVKKAMIGKCVAQVMCASELLDAMLMRLKDEPGLFISNNPNMGDGVWQMADIFRAEFKKEAFTLAADSQFAGRYIEEIIDNLKRFGIDKIVLSFVNNQAWDKIDKKKRKWYLAGLKNAGIKVVAIKVALCKAEAAIDLLKEAGCKTFITASNADESEINKVTRTGYKVCVENLNITGEQAVELVQKLSRVKLTVAFNPLSFAMAEENPFLKTYSQNSIKRLIGALYINDGLVTGERTPLEEGLGEIKELISILRARSFDGLFVLQGRTPEKFGETVSKFISMLKELGDVPKDN